MLEREEVGFASEVAPTPSAHRVSLCAELSPRKGRARRRRLASPRRTALRCARVHAPTRRLLLRLQLLLLLLVQELVRIVEAPLNRGSNERAQMLAVDLIFVDAVQRLAHVVVEDTRWEGKEMLRLCFNRLVLRLHDVALSRALAWAVQRDDERALFRLANDAETSIVPAAAHRGPGRGGGDDGRGR